LYGQRVEVGAKGDASGGLAGRAEVDDESRRREPLERDAGGVELGGYQLGGVLLLPGELGVRVDLATQRNQRWGQVVDVGDQVGMTGHGGEATAPRVRLVGASTG
jgi:hypothetical protein